MSHDSLEAMDRINGTLVIVAVALDGEARRRVLGEVAADCLRCLDLPDLDAVDHAWFTEKFDLCMRAIDRTPKEVS